MVVWRKPRRCSVCGHVHTLPTEGKWNHSTAPTKIFCTWCGDHAPALWRARPTHTCDGCGKERHEVVACGRDAAGDPDAPDLCVFCRRESVRHRFFDRERGRYVHVSYVG